MGLILFSGDPGSGAEEAARATAQRLANWELLTEARLNALVEEEFGPSLPAVARPDALTSIVARAALDHALIVCAPGCDGLFAEFPQVLRVRVEATPQRRAGRFMLERRLDRPAAEALVRDLDRHRQRTRARFAMTFDEDLLTPDQMAAMATAVAVEEKLDPAREAQIQFAVRMRLAEHGLLPAAKAAVRRKAFANRSEQIFANLLDFYRIRWEYEPRTFVLSDQGNGEAFTPDFYLPDSDLYIELTTMKQALVTKKNRKVKLLRERYPDINIQVFYQRDFQNLIFKHGVADA